MEIPKSLVDQIKTGNVVLFLGAGASYDAIHPEGKKIPLGNVLSDMIVDEFLTDDYKGEALQIVSELAISECNLYDLQQFIYEVFEPFQPNATHSKIPNFIWKAIVTVNYDYIVERAYEGKKTSQKLAKFIKNGDRYRDKVKTNKDLPFYKIHGCISDISDIHTPLILTPNQYITHRKNRDRLFTKLEELAGEYSFLFVGFSFRDPDIREILIQLEQLKDGKPRSYMVGPGIKDSEVRLWEGKKITSIKATFEEFINELEKKVDNNSNALALSFVPNKKFHKVFERTSLSLEEHKPSESLIDLLDNDIEYIHENFTSVTTDPKEFYKGYFVNWDPIIKDYDSKRTITDNILYEVFLQEKLHSKENLQFFMLLGYAGSGKSVSLKRIAWEAGIQLKRICLFLKPNTVIKPEPIIELFNFVKERIYIFIDDISEISTDLDVFLRKIEKEKIPVTILGSERINIWNTQCQDLSTKTNDIYKLEYLNDREIKLLVDKLDYYDSLGYLKEKSESERINALSYKAGRELLVALYESTMGKPFAEIVVDEYNSIPDDKAKSVYLTVSILHRLGGQARAGLISRIHNISFSRFKEQLLKPLEFIVFDRLDNRLGDIVYITRHRQIAEIVFSEVLRTKQLKFDEYYRLLSFLDIDYENDRNAFLSMINARNLMELFSDPEMIRELYQVAIKKNPRDAKLLQQNAIFEMSAKGGNINKSEQLLNEATKIQKNDSVIQHSFVELALNKAERSKNPMEINASLIEGERKAKALINKKKDEPYPYHSLLKINLFKLKSAISGEDAPTIERIIKETEELFSNVNQLFPHQEFLLEAESKFNAILQNSPKAIELLEKAYNLNKRSPYLCLRLADIYEKNDQFDKAIDTLEETLKIIPNDKDINFRYALVLIKYKPGDLTAIQHHLKRSFTKGDNRYQAQFWYARTLYLIGEIHDAKQIFNDLSKVKTTQSIKNMPRAKVRKEGNLIRFKGIISTIESQYGFIKLDKIGDDIFFYKYQNKSSENIWNSLSKNKRVSFNLAFNYKGAIAVNIRTE
ncbi:SIR2 family protein [Chryseobacterium gambrini]|uniref:SIR2 family protein n=1 Tax=Chryseobacterium gambrini TaxID=373672 RepID=UPI0022F17E64|nr:SIR2 family protein [Chryseobacterium gambrini]WBV51919.1 SIR2 family protein [Chryseobacterium gambrini]